MKRGRLPLTALRTFEAAGRRQSFTGAAQELFISQAAVSRQIRQLELMLRRALFDRGHRSVRLTAAGKELLAVLTPSFDAIGARLDSLAAGNDTSTVSINSEPSFATCWLVPHLAEFRRENPQIEVEVDVDSRLVDFRQDTSVVAIRHSRTAQSWPRAESRHLADVRLTPAMAPALVDKAGLPAEPADLLRHVLLHEERRQNWREWFEAAGSPSDGAERGPVFADEGLTQQAALRAQGVALLDERLSDEAVRAGQLIRPFDLSIPFGAYWVVARSFDRLPAAAAVFVGWLEGRLGASRDAAG